MAKGRGLWLDSVGDQTGKRRLGKPSKAHFLRKFGLADRWLRTVVGESAFALMGRRFKCCRRHSQASITPREGRFGALLPKSQSAETFQSAPHEGAISTSCPLYCRSISFQSAPHEGAIWQNCPVPSTFSLYLLPNVQNPKGFFIFLQFNLQKGGRSCLNAGANPSGKYCALPLRTARISAAPSRQSPVWRRCAPPCSGSGSPDCKSAGCPSLGR